ncbi:MAG: hypothetical protein ACE5PT_12810 [Gemmatimonadales bacterium]
MPASTSALALGNSFLFGLRQPDVLFYNPALTGSTEGTVVSVQHYGRPATSGSLASSLDLLGGGFGMGVQALTYGARVAEPVETADSLFVRGLEGASEIAATLAYGREILGLHLGVAAKAIEQRLGGNWDATVAADVGAAVGDVDEIVVALAVRNLGPSLSTAATDLPLPLTVTLAAATGRTPVGPLDVAGAASISRWRDGSIVPAGGLEISYWPIAGRTILGRLGVRRVPNGGAWPLTFGAAFIADGFTLEYALERFPDAGNSHRIGIGWR